MSQNPYLFVVGCPRSGTTLLQRMLDNHPFLSVANDTHFIPEVLDECIPDPNVKLTQELREAEYVRIAKSDHNIPLTPQLVDRVRTYWRFSRLGLSDSVVDEAAAGSQTYSEFVSALYDQLGRQHGKPMAGEKTPGYVRWIRLLRTLFPSAKFVHIIRDGRDVALSTLDWAKAHRGPRRFRLWDDEPIAVCALWWSLHMTKGRRDGAALGPSDYCEVSYEQLVAKPDETLRSLAAFLGIECAPEMALFYEGKVRHDAGLSAKQAWLPPTPGLRDWRTQMTERDIQLFEAIAGELLSDLGYECRFRTLPAETIALADRCRNEWRASKWPRIQHQSAAVTAINNRLRA